MKKEKRSFYLLFFALVSLLFLALSRLSYRLGNTLDAQRQLELRMNDN